MNNAQLVAELLTARFLEGGNFVSAVPMSDASLKQIMPASASSQLDIEQPFDEWGYAGLAVQAVGYEDGVSEPRVHVYVSKGSRKKTDSIPIQDGDVAIEVNRIGKLIVKPEQANAVTNSGNVFLRKTRVACGSSCAPSGENYSGTFGALVRKSSGNHLYALSNNHVLAACNHTPVGMSILSPSSMDGRPNPVRAPGEIARHSEICELRSGVPALVSPCEADIAIARVTNADQVSSWQGDAKDGFDTPVKVVAPKTDLKVKKFGRTTGLTTGMMQAKLTLTPIPYRSKFFTATVYFKDVWTVLGNGGTAFALPGDSGSLVVTENSDATVGVVFAAGQGGYGIIIPMGSIVGCFGGIKLVGGHGVRP
jgi:hypothetical protein